MKDCLFNIVLLLGCFFGLCVCVALSFWLSAQIVNFFKNSIAKLFTDKEPTKIVQVKALKFYASQRAVIMISTFVMIGYITVYQPGDVAKNIWIFPSCLLLLCVSMFYTYLVIVDPLFKDGANYFATSKYKMDVNDYRKDMNVVFTLFFLTTFMIAIVSYLLPTKIDTEIVNLSKWLTVPLFASGIIYLVGAEKKLEDIYCIYYPDEYYKSNVIKLL